MDLSLLFLIDFGQFGVQMIAIRAIGFLELSFKAAHFLVDLFVYSVFLGLIHLLDELLILCKVCGSKFFDSVLLSLVHLLYLLLSF